MNKGLGKLKNKIALLFLFLISCGFSTPIFAQTNTYTGASGGNWNTTSNWSLNLVPTAAHNVVIPDNKNVTVNTNSVCNSLTINTGTGNNNVSIGANTLTVTGAILINASTSNNKTKQVTVTTGVLNCASITMATTAGDTRDCRITTTSGIVNVTGNITMNGAALRNQLRINGTATTGGTLNIGGSLTGGDFLSANNNSTINFNGTSAQTIPINADYIYNKLVVNNAAGATLQAAITATKVTDNITVQSGMLNNGGFAIAGNFGKTFTVANGSFLVLSGTTSSFPSGFGTNTLGATSTVEYSGIAAQTVFDVATPGYGNLTISNNSTKTVAAGLDIQGNVTVNSSTTLAFTTFTHNITGNLLNSGTVTVTTGPINIGGNWTNNGTFTPGVAGTVIFNSTTTGKTLSGTLSGTTGKFHNLTFNGVGGGWTIAGDLDVNNTLAVTNGTVSMSGTLSIAGNTPVTVAAGGTISFENNASLMQTGYTGANIGNITYKRKTSSVLSSDYTYWSSPVAGQKLIDVSPSYLSGLFYSFNDFAIPENWKQEAATAEMIIGKGYIIRGSKTITPPAFYDANFVGIPNNGTKTISIGPIGSSNLIGNPYPSAIDANLFLAANSGVIEGTLYFWTHSTGINNGQYTDNDYATYNGTGGAAGNGIVPSGMIAAGQSFFTTSTTTGGTATFTNAMRVAGNNSQFFKTRNPKTKSAIIEKNRIWLNLTNTQGAFKQTLIGYVTDATNNYDSRFDGESFDGNEFVDFYSVDQDKNLVIQGRALPFDEKDEVPLGYRTTIDGDFTINIDQVDGSLTNQAVFIEDKLTNTVFDLKSGNYTFNTVAGTFNDRFVLRYTNKTLATKNFDSLENKVLVSSKNKQIKIYSFAETIDKVTIYDLLGRPVYQKDKVDSNELSIANLVSSHQTLVVKTSLQNGTTVTDKIIY